MKDKFEYEEVEKFNEELLKKQKGEYDLKQKRLDAIYKNKDKYRNAKIAERLYQQALKERT